MPDDGPGLFTIGHLNQALDHFLSLLQWHGIEAVADVRTAPWSRYVPQFNAKALGAALASRGIGYVPLAANSAAARGRRVLRRGRTTSSTAGRRPARHSGMASTRSWPGPGRPVSPCSAARRIAPVPPPPAHRAGARERAVGLSHVRRDGRMETEAELAALEAGGIATGPRAGDDSPAILFGDGGGGDQSWRSPGPVPRKRRPPSPPAR